METKDKSNGNSIIDRKIELDTTSLSLISNIRTWTLILSIIGFISVASYVWFKITLNASPGKWTIEGHRGFAWTDLAEGLLIVLFLVSVVSLMLFSLQMGKLVNKLTNVDASGLLIRPSLLRLRNHFKFLGITIILIIVVVLYSYLSSNRKPTGTSIL